ncbi:hypothetical protein BJ165DRAFT_1529702 [Panaeolus papilionaceus]|nr:hypothetical protein BJ165DRAFT_1529702 [Panaeolus papilionaceus]
MTSHIQTMAAPVADMSLNFPRLHASESYATTTWPPVALIKRGAGNSSSKASPSASASQPKCEGAHTQAPADRKSPSLHKRYGNYAMGEPTIEMLGGAYPYISVGQQTRTQFSCSSRLRTGFMDRNEIYSTGKLCYYSNVSYIKIIQGADLTRGRKLFYPTSLRTALEINALMGTGQLVEWRSFIRPEDNKKGGSKVKGDIYLVIKNPQGYLIKDIPESMLQPQTRHRQFVSNLSQAIRGAIIHFAKDSHVYNGALNLGNVFVDFLDGTADGKLAITFGDWSYTQLVISGQSSAVRSQWTVSEDLDEHAIVQTASRVSGYAQVMPFASAYHCVT